MRILLINPPHPSIGSRIPHEHLPPLGLLSVGGPLIDAGHDVELLDAEFGPMSTQETVERAVTYAPQAILIGHSGSTSGHPVVAEITRAIREELPAVWIVYGGVFPTYHWREILTDERQIDVIVCGEGEETILHVIDALETETPLDDVPGIAFRDGDGPTLAEFLGPAQDAEVPAASNSDAVVPDLVYQQSTVVQASAASLPRFT